jgi:hypothetical protein
MAVTERITMTMRELDRLKIIQAIVEMGLKPGRAAERMVSRRPGRPRNRKLDDAPAAFSKAIISCT